MKAIDLTSIIDAVENTLNVDFCNEHRRGIELIAAEYLKQKAEAWVEEREHTPHGIVEKEVSLMGHDIYFIRDNKIGSGTVWNKRYYKARLRQQRKGYRLGQAYLPYKY